MARDLLGRHLVRALDGDRLVVRIVETEAYVGESDLACHAARGRTARNDPLYRRPGTLYVYFSYGMHWLLNVVTEREGFPAAVLLRAAEQVRGLEVLRAQRPGVRDRDLLRGPARLTRALGIDGRLNGGLVTGGEVWLARGAPVGEEMVARTPRVGVEYAGPSRASPWRFLVAGSASVSGPGAPARLNRSGR